MTLFWLKASAVAVVAFAAAAAFTAYFQPDMLVGFANLVLCQ